MDDSKTNLQKYLRQLSKMSPEDRMDIYEELDRQSLHACNGRVFRFERTEMRITDDGRIVRRPFEAFLSHSSKDKPFVRSLDRRLKALGVATWLDEAELSFGDSLVDRLSKAIETVDVVIAVISRNSVDSAWVKEEIKLAMTEEIHQRRVKVIPVLIDDAPVPHFIKGKLYADFTTPHKRRRNFARLVDSISAHADGGKLE